jgi:hypothetical protein
MRAFLLLACLAFSAIPCINAQETKTEPPKFTTPLARLQAAKSVYLRQIGGNDVPFNVIESAMEGWGRYTLVNAAEKADLIMEVNAPQESAASISSSVSSDSAGGKSTTTSTKDLAVLQIKVSVLDARNGVTLWTATERPKGGFKQRAREENLIESSLKLFRQFRDRVEPQNAESQPSSR